MTKQQPSKPKVKNLESRVKSQESATDTGKNTTGEQPTDGLNWKLRSHILEKDAITLLRALTQVAANVELLEDRVREALVILNDYNCNSPTTNREILKWNDGCVTDAQGILLEMRQLIASAQDHGKAVPLSKYLAEVVGLIKND